MLQIATIAYITPREYQTVSIRFRQDYHENHHKSPHGANNDKGARGSTINENGGPTVEVLSVVKTVEIMVTTNLVDDE